MKPTTLSNCLAGLVGVLTLCGCATTGYQMSDTTAAGLQRASQNLSTETRTLEATLTSLNDLVNKPTGDLRTQFLLFSRSLDQATASSHATQDSLNDVRREGTTYFSTWDRQSTNITNADIRTRSQARRKEVGEQFDSTLGRFRDAQSAVKPVLAYLEDIRKALSVDLTTDGLSGTKDIVENANVSSAGALKGLKQSASEVKALGAKLSFFASDTGTGGGTGS
jgi:hypothetical protein